MLEWLRDDVLGEGACVTTPFGQRRVTYADHIASGRPLASVEDALRSSVLPLYANTHTESSGQRGVTIDHRVFTQQDDLAASERVPHPVTLIRNGRPSDRPRRPSAVGLLRSRVPR